MHATLGEYPPLGITGSPRTQGKQRCAGFVLVPFFLAVQAPPLQENSSAMRVTPQVVTPSNRAHPPAIPRTRKESLSACWPMVNIGLGPQSARMDKAHYGEPKGKDESALQGGVADFGLWFRSTATRRAGPSDGRAWMFTGILIQLVRRGM